MRPHETPAPDPRRFWYLRAYGRAVAAVLLVFLGLFLWTFPARELLYAEITRPLTIEPLTEREVYDLIGAILGFDVTAPVTEQFAAFAVQMLGMPGLLLAFSVAGLSAVVLEWRDRVGE